MGIGYDLDNDIIDEGQILGIVGSNDYDTEELDDPRRYCAILSSNGKAYAISVYDNVVEKEIRKKEGIPDSKPIPTIVKPLEEMKDYELLYEADPFADGFIYCYYRSDLNELRKKLDNILKNENGKVKRRDYGTKHL